jgi:phosphate-selective porin OprO and OprP
MRLSRITGVLLAATMLALPHTAVAQAISAEEAAELRAQLAALKAQVSALEARLDARTAPVAIPAAAPAPAVPAKPSTEINWRGAPELRHKDGWSFKPRGRVLIDAATVDAPDALVDRGLGFATELRRVRLGVEGTIPGGFGYRLEGDFADNGVELVDAYLNYRDGAFRATIGQHNDFQSFEELTSSNDTSFIERAAFTDAFGFQRKVGLSGEYSAGIVLVQAGVFTGNVDDLVNDEFNGVSVSGRMVAAPKLGKTQLHLGASAHWRNISTSVLTTRYRQRPLVHTTDTRFIGTPGLELDSEKRFGLEAGLIHGRFHAAGEVHWLNAQRDGRTDPTFFGGAIEAGLFLTDDTRGYASGIFRSVKVKKPVGQGGFGAVQVNVRYDHLDLIDGGIVGGKQDGYMASLIWTPIDYVRFMLNYARLQYDDAVIPIAGDRSYGVNALGVRAQVSF